MTAVTDLLHDRADLPLLALAHGAAEAAAKAAAVDIRCLEDVGDLESAQRLCERIWRTGESGPPVTADLLRAMAKAGSHIGGAYEGDELVGTCFGFFSPPARAALHSHIAGVLPRMRRRNVGYALKLHQRAWALARGVREICWTYDPLVRRNAYFNLAKLGAEAAEYLPDFYGPIHDGINRGDASDRVLVRWRLDTRHAVSACAGETRQEDATAALAAGAAVALGISAQGAPALERPDHRARTLLVAVPADIEALREADPASAARWRTAVRDVLGGLLEEGARIRGFDRSGWYVVDRDPETAEEETL